MDTPEAGSSRLPARLGRYAVRRRIGSGGFATVWLAYDEQLDSPVAIKVLADNWTEDQHVRSRFVEEGRYLRRVESPYVVSVYDAGELADGRPYLVMSYADQGTLADLLDAGGLSVAQALDVVRDIGAGLQALHDRGIVHRDVKPANVLFRIVRGDGSEDGIATEKRAMLGDLGLGKALDGSSRLTMIGGTPAFIAPEQAAGESPGPAADQYSLAALAYLMLTGRRPFDRVLISDAARPVAREPVSTPGRPFPDIVEVVLGRALSFAPTDRYPRVSEFVAALRAALAPAVTADAPGTRLPADPDLTQPGPRPSLTTLPAPVGASAPDRGRRSGRSLALLVGVPLGLLALAAGGVAGYAAQRSRHADVTVASAGGALSVTVPEAWDRAQADGRWRPPGSAQDFDAVSVGTNPGWNEVRARAQGVFVGLLPGTALPAQLPQHPECDRAGEPFRSGTGARPSVTVVYAGCPGGVTVERVVRVTGDELLWVQIRSASPSAADDVLSSVRTSER